MLKMVIPTRKRLLFLIRKNHPKVPLKYNKSFELIVQECLVKLLRFQFPLNQDDSYFLSNEVNNFAKMVPQYFIKCSRQQVTMLKRHQAFFDKPYPYEVPSPPAREKKTYASKSRSQQYKDRAKIAKEDRDAVFGAATMLLQKDGHGDAAIVVKRISENPSVGNDLRKALAVMDESKSDERLIYFCLRLNGTLNLDHLYFLVLF